MTACSRCGEQVSERAKFCPECGHALAPPAVRREERKIVSVVFCDLVGSTAQAEALDPEDVRALLSGYYEQVRAELERFGGTVEKFIGDAVMAVFGAPVAHEDDPERAVRAALAVRDAAVRDGGLQVRVAVNTGEALVALDARASEGEALVAGDVVNTAARLQSAAPPNGVLVGEQTYRATERAIDYEVHAGIDAKGKSEPVRSWLAVEARAGQGVDLTAAPSTPLVGRARELDLLVTSLARVVEERSPQLVTLVGVPGIGKSRLLGELFAHVDRSEDLVTWRQGRSLPYGDGVSYWALGEMVKAQAGVLETDDAEQSEAKLAAAVAALIGDANDASWVLGHLRPLVGLSDESGGAADRRGEAFAAWRRFFESLAEQRPLVLVFEDLHWADDGLLDFVDHLVDWLTDVSVLVVATSRPELLTRRASWGGGKPNATTVSLPPLSDTETAKLVHSLLRTSVLPAELQSTLLERAGGNPLYAQEFARMAAERGATVVELPDSVQGIIAARLDAIASGDKELLQDAAVVGKVFWSGALAAIGERSRDDVEELLHALERRELVRRARRSSVAGESEYSFAHALVRDVAYAAIPRAARAERHRRAAEWIESLGRPEDHGDLLAHHYLAALELARTAGVDAGVLASSAVRALRWAGDRTFALNSFAGAARFYEAALELVEDEADRRAILFQFGRSLHHDADERRLEVLEAARDAHIDADDPATAAEAGTLLAIASWHRGAIDAAERHVELAQELVRGAEASPARVNVLAEVARLAMLRDDVDEALRAGGEALELARELGLDDTAILTTIGTARPDEDGMRMLEEVVERARATNNPEAARAFNNLATVHFDRGDFEQARAYWLEGRDFATRVGNETVRRFIEPQLMSVDYDLGRWDEALRAADAFIDECRSTPHYHEGTAHSFRALILAGRDDLDGAAAASARSLELAREIGDPQSLLPDLAVALRVEVERGRRDAAARLAQELLDAARRSSRGLGSIALVRAAEWLGIEDEVRALVDSAPPSRWIDAVRPVLERDYEAAADAFGAMGDLANEAEFRLRAAEAYAADGRRADADRNLLPALAFFRTAAAMRYVRRGEALLAKSA